VLLSCGGDPDPVCGDMNVDMGEQCDDGNDDETDSCRMCQAYIAPRTTVKWAFNAEVVPEFMNDGCSDVGARDVDVVLTGPTTDMRRIGCSERQVTFVDLAPGEYTATVTPLDNAGTSLVTAPPPGVTFPANTTPNTTQEYTVVVPPEAWARPMTGTFFFILRWAGMECGTAAPPVTTQVVTLMRTPGGPVTQMANVNSATYPSYRLDGTQPVGCVPSMLSQAEAAPGVPFGRATITVSGRDVGGAEWFRGEFDTFIGAGTSNPVYTFDVQSTVDAAVDAPIDAPVDAGVDAELDAPIDAMDIDAEPDA
jgi:hypothetical protein